MSFSSANDAAGSSNREAKGFLVLIVVLCIPFVTQYTYRYFFQEEPDTAVEFSYIKEECKPVKPFRAHYNKDQKQSYVYPIHKQKDVQLIDINTADSIALESLPGIGFKLASRIMKYRTLLRGYRSVEQLKEVYGLTPETYNQIKSRCFVSASAIKKIPADSLWNTPYKLYHPYLSKELKSEISMKNKSESYRTELLQAMVLVSNQKLDWYIKY